MCKTCSQRLVTTSWLPSATWMRLVIQSSFQPQRRTLKNGGWRSGLPSKIVPQALRLRPPLYSGGLRSSVDACPWYYVRLCIAMSWVALLRGRGRRAGDGDLVVAWQCCGPATTYPSLLCARRHFYRATTHFPTRVPVARARRGVTSGLDLGTYCGTVSSPRIRSPLYKHTSGDSILGQNVVPKCIRYCVPQWPPAATCRRHWRRAVPRRWQADSGSITWRVPCSVGGGSYV